MIMALDHIQLAMPPGAEGEARRFWAETLGLTEIAKPPPLDERGGCWFAGPGTVIHVGVDQDFTPQRRAHPGLVVRDLDLARQTLVDHGFEVVEDQEAPAGVSRIYTADPFGNRIELLGPGSGFAGRSDHG
ncbi:MAG: glyoxalase [Actinobacteria bacterium]|nr:glyoxalase [Actinomycetota bacterium]